MSYQATKEYLAAVADRYKKGFKQGKSTNRSYVGDGINQKASGRPKKYPVALLLPHIQFIWIQMEKISARRMMEAYSDCLHVYKKP